MSLIEDLTPEEQAILQNEDVINAKKPTLQVKSSELDNDNSAARQSEIAETTDPYARTSSAQEEAMKSWRQMLMDSHKKREAERTKRLRSAQIVGLGKALGDMLGAAFAGAGSTKGNYAAVVPQAQAPKSVERVQQLINEGVVNAKDYDNMMQSLAMQEGRDKIALARAMDELDIRKQQIAAQQAFAAQQAKDQREFAAQQAKDQREFAAQQAKDQREFATSERVAGQEHQVTMQQGQQAFAAEQAAKAAQAQAQAKAAEQAFQIRLKQIELGQKGLSTSDKRLLALEAKNFPETTTTKRRIYDELTSSYKDVEETVPFELDDNTAKTYLTKTYSDMIYSYDLDPTKEADKDVYVSIKLYADPLVEEFSHLGVTKDQIVDAFKRGKTADEIRAYLKNK